MSEDNTKVAWNMAAGMIQEIQLLRAMANRNFISGNLYVASKALHATYMTVIGSLTPKERESLDQKSSDLIKAIINNQHYLTRDSSFNEKPKDFVENQIKIIQLYEKFNTALMDLLELHGYLISKQKDASKMNF